MPVDFAVLPFGALSARSAFRSPSVHAVFRSASFCVRIRVSASPMLCSLSCLLQVKVRVVRTAVGDVSGGDVDMAVGSKAVLVAFNVKVPAQHAKTLKSTSVQCAMLLLRSPSLHAVAVRIVFTLTILSGHQQFAASAPNASACSVICCVHFAGCVCTDVCIP